MEPLDVVRALALGIFTLACGCGGATPTELDEAMPNALDDTTTDLAANHAPTSGDAGALDAAEPKTRDTQEDRPKRAHGKHKP